MRPVVIHRFLLAVAFAITALVYWPGLSGGFLFDDYPNIVDNEAVQPHDASVPSLVRAALSSPSSEFKRPLASLSFAANYLATGLDPYWMKLTNLVIHLLNGLLVFLLARSLLSVASAEGATPSRASFPRTRESTLISRNDAPDSSLTSHSAGESRGNGEQAAVHSSSSADQARSMIAVLIAAGWMLLPINLTGVLYVVQRMESLANLFMLLGLLGYVHGRRLMLSPASAMTNGHRAVPGLLLCTLSVTVPAALGLLAKETAVMLPLYALLVEWALFRFRTAWQKTDWRVVVLFGLVLVLPLLAGLAWLAPKLLGPWATRDFTLGTRLLTEARIVSDYVAWTLLPTPHALSFYHDDFSISTGLLSPWTTLAGIIFLATLAALACWLRARRPLAALGIALYLGCHLLTGTVLPLELIYEHRNYFASFGLLLAIIPLLAAPGTAVPSAPPVNKGDHGGYIPTPGSLARGYRGALPMPLARYVLLAGLMLLWTGLTTVTSHAWGNPLHLAEELAARAPQSPRAQYELGRTYIIYSHYDPASPFTPLAYAPLERSAALPGSSILPEQALIFMNARMHRPVQDAWWQSMIAKLKAEKPGVQDESSLGALTQCAREHSCDLPKDRMVAAYLAAIDHPQPSARLLAAYSDYAWNVLDDHALGERMAIAAVQAKPSEPAYRITLIRMLLARGRTAEARSQLRLLQALNVGGSLDSRLDELRARMPPG